MRHGKVDHVGYGQTARQTTHENVTGLTLLVHTLINIKISEQMSVHITEKIRIEILHTKSILTHIQNPPPKKQDTKKYTTSEWQYVL